MNQDDPNMQMPTTPTDETPMETPVGESPAMDPNGEGTGLPPVAPTVPVPAGEEGQEPAVPEDMPVGTNDEPQAE